MVCECELVRDFKRSGSCLGKRSLDELFQELNSLYLKLISSSSSKTKKKTRYGRRSVKPSGCFHMRVSDEDFEITDSDDDQENHDRRRFGCDDDDDLYLSDSEYKNDLALQYQSHLMKRAGLVKVALLELTHQRDLELKEDVRSQVTAFATELSNEYEKFSSDIIHIRKYRDARRELERRFDTQYNRKIAQDLDSYLTTIRRYNELKSQIEERKITSDAAFEEANSKEKALQLDKLRQDNAKAEAEELRDYDKRRVAEEAKFAALEAEEMAAKEAADKEANDHRLILEAAKKQTNAQKETSIIEQLPDDILRHILSSLTTLADRARTSILSQRWRNLWRSTFCHLFEAAKSSKKAEYERLQMLQELREMNNRLKMSSKQDFSSQEKKIARLVRQITGTSDSVMKKSTEFIKILYDHECPHSISLVAFAEKIVSQSYCFAGTVFAAGHVVVLVTSQVPHAMDIILAELHKACIYTVPKHIAYSKSVFDSRESYLKFLGYRKVDGKLERCKDFLIRVESCIKLYAALIQTQVDGIRNPHGLEAGWTWIATVLNNIPANINIYTTVALATFLEMAGFALYKKYKAQFIKLLEVISEHFLKSLREQKEPRVGRYIASIESYIEHEAFLQEPEGWRLQGKLLSNEKVPVA